MWVCLGLVFYDGADAAVRFKFGVDAVEGWRDFVWMCLRGLLIQTS